jgi:PAS domain S-box-containing protein
MRPQEIKRLVESTSDVAFAVDPTGVIAAWNKGAEELFGLTAEEAVGRECRFVLKGADECGAVCSADCTVRQTVARRHPVGNFDLQVETPRGRKWCNVSVLAAEDGHPNSTYSIHIVREVDLRKRLEVLVRDFVSEGTSLPADKTLELISATRAPAKDVDLTKTEIKVLRLLARGLTTGQMADELHVSPTTVNNHVQHILKKLNAHTRLEAVRRAEHAGLI